MIILILATFLASCLFATFKYISIYNIPPFYTIVVNYIVSTVLAIVLINLMGVEGLNADLVKKPWFPLTIALGCISMIDFNLVSFTTKKVGVSITSAASKLSLLIPFTAAILLFDEEVTTVKVVGILVALVALYLISVKKKNNDEKLAVKKIYLFLPFFVFLGSGLNDLIMLTLGKMNSGSNGTSSVIVVFLVFLMASIAAIATSLIRRVPIRSFFEKKVLVSGVVLGTVSIGCFFCYLTGVGLATEAGWDGSVLATIFAVGTLLLSILFWGVFIFKEKLSINNWIGLVLAILAIFVLTY
jgi:drug/metabolite transporter (DMT)-like permease